MPLVTVMAESGSAIGQQGFGASSRRDAWWIELVPVIVVLGAFSVYATWRTFENAYYEWGPYLSPFYSPLIKPRWWPLSPAILILWAPLGFRATCYYYRKAYYRAFFLDPPACAVGEPRAHRYKGETAFPLILQNLHRYFLYVALIFLVILGTTQLARFGSTVTSASVWARWCWWSISFCYPLHFLSFAAPPGGRKS